MKIIVPIELCLSDKIQYYANFYRIKFFGDCIKLFNNL